MTTGRIVLHTELHEGIYQSDRDRWAARDETFAVGPRGRRAAWAAYCERRRELAVAFGGIGQGSTRLTLDGRDLARDLQDESYDW